MKERQKFRFKMTNSIKNKTILVLGGVGSIGSTISDLLEKEGARVFRHDLVGEYAADVRDETQLKSLIENIIKRSGPIYGLVNSVSAPIKIGGFEKKKWSDFSEQLGVQLKAAVVSAEVLIPRMKENGGGAIVNILSSYVMDQPPASLTDYVTAKYAMLGFSKSLAKDLEKYKITVNAVSPSLIKNNFSAGVPEKLLEIMAAQSPTGRLTNPEDVARAVLELIADTGITGKNIQIVGGKILE